MEFGKLPSLSGVDWSLPQDTDLTKLLLDAQPGPHQRTSLFVGSTAWGPREFVGPVYPKGTKPAAFLAAYGKQFNTIELNTTFYRMPDAAQVSKWAAATPEDFRFCPKVNKLISQSKDLAVSHTRLTDFTSAVRHFGAKLGPCFLQLPPTFSTDKLDVLRSFLDAWPRALRLTVEFRHASWFVATAGADGFAELFARGFGTVITDVSGRRDVAHMHLSAPYVLVRWVGNIDGSDALRLSDWVLRLDGWFSRGLAEAYVFTHQPEPVPSAETAEAFVEFWRAKAKLSSTFVKTRGPVVGLDAVAAPSAQGNLF